MWNADYNGYRFELIHILIRYLWFIGLDLDMQTTKSIIDTYYKIPKADRYIDANVNDIDIDSSILRTIDTYN